MHTSLPTELVLAIIVEAAECFVVTDRASAVSLALTAHHVYQIVRPILLRRVYITWSNYNSVIDVITKVEPGALVLDLTFVQSWDPKLEILSCLKNLRCIRGMPEIIDKTISLLPQSARESLRDIHVFYEDIISYVPPGVTRLCVYFDQRNYPPIERLDEWLRAAQSITHLGAEFVERGDGDIVLPLSDFVQALGRILTATGPRLKLIAIRVCGDGTNEEWEQHLLEGLKAWSRSSAMATIHADRRVALWPDRRIFNDPDDEKRAKLDDIMAGVDIWSEARVLAEW